MPRGHRVGKFAQFNGEHLQLLAERSVWHRWIPQMKIVVGPNAPTVCIRAFVPGTRARETSVRNLLE
jgi:hypothetical protein